MSATSPARHPANRTPTDHHDISADTADPESGSADVTLPVTGGSAVPRADGPAAAALTPGTTVGGRYRLVSLVSADGCAWPPNGCSRR